MLNILINIPNRLLLLVYYVTGYKAYHLFDINVTFLILCGASLRVPLKNVVGYYTISGQNAQNNLDF